MMAWRRRMTGMWLAAGTALLTCACMEVAGGSSSTETGDKVALTGRVVGGGGEPVAGARVALLRAGISDVTDAQGYYELLGTSDAQPATASTPDTLDIHVYGQPVMKRPVTLWVGGLTGVQVVQRGFSGMLLTNNDIAIARIEGVVTGDGITPGDSVAATFYYNALAGNYSGFVYFPPPESEVRNYNVWVNAYDTDGHLVGHSVVVPFSSLAGNITIPAFDPGNVITGIPAPQSRRAVGPR